MLDVFIFILEISSIKANVGSATSNTRLYHLYMQGSCIQIYVIQDDRISDSNVSSENISACNLKPWSIRIKWIINTLRNRSAEQFQADTWINFIAVRSEMGFLSWFLFRFYLSSIAINLYHSGIVRNSLLMSKIEALIDERFGRIYSFLLTWEISFFCLL